MSTPFVKSNSVFIRLPAACTASVVISVRPKSGALNASSILNASAVPNATGPTVAVKDHGRIARRATAGRSFGGTFDAVTSGDGFGSLRVLSCSADCATAGCCA